MKNFLFADFLTSFDFCCLLLKFFSLFRVLSKNAYLFFFSNRSTSRSTNTTLSTITIPKLNKIRSSTTSSKARNAKSHAAPSLSKNTKISSILSIWNTTKSNATTAMITGSSTEEDDYDIIVNDDEVSDELSADNGDDLINECSDGDNSSNDISTTISSLSSDHDSNWSALEDDVVSDDLNELLSSTIIEEDEFLNKSFAELSVLLFKVHVLLKRIRKLVAMIRNVNALHRFVIKQIKLKLENLNRELEAQNKDKINYKELTLDTKIRWNSSFVMISRFLFYSSIITLLTHNLPEEINLKSHQRSKLKKTIIYFTRLLCIKST